MNPEGLAKGKTHMIENKLFSLVFSFVDLPAIWRVCCDSDQSYGFHKYLFPKLYLLKTSSKKLYGFSV